MSLNVRSGFGQIPTFVFVPAVRSIALAAISGNVSTPQPTSVTVTNRPGLALAKFNAIVNNNVVVDVLNRPGLPLATLIADPDFDTRVFATRPSLPMNGGFTHTVSAVSGTGAPVWQTVPTVTFTKGAGFQTYNVAPHVSDNDPLTITKNALAFHDASLSYNQAQQRYEYTDAVSSVAGGTNGHILTADDAQAPVGQLTGLDFAGNLGAVSIANRVAIRWTGAALIPIYGTSGNGVTYIWKYRPAQQNGYYSTFFWGNDDGAGTVAQTFLWKSGAADSYYGMHPYPPGGSSGSTHQWEISIEQNDFLGATVVKGVWYSQAARVRGANGAVKEHEFYWNLPNTDAANRIFRTSPATWGNAMPPFPAFTWADAPWQPSVERGAGVHRGVIIVSAYLNLSQINTLAPLETDAQVLAALPGLGLTPSQIWYLNMNWTTTDISDKSGNGHHPVFVNANRPAQYTASANLAPVWQSSVNQSLTVGVAFSLNLDTLCADPEAQPLTYTIVTGTLPAGITQSGARGQTISGTPTTAQAPNVTFRATD